MPNETPTRAEMVRAALAELGEAPPQEVASFIQRRFGVKMQPAIVLVIRASFRERALLEQTRKAALERMEREKGGEAPG